MITKGISINYEQEQQICISARNFANSPKRTKNTNDRKSHENDHKNVQDNKSKIDV